MIEEEIKEQIEQLERQLTQRGNQLIAQDPMSQRIFGQIEAYKAMMATECGVIPNGEAIKESE